MRTKLKALVDGSFDKEPWEIVFDRFAELTETEKSFLVYATLWRIANRENDTNS